MANNKLDKAITRVRGNANSDETALTTVEPTDLELEMARLTADDGVVPISSEAIIRSVKEEGFVPAERFLELAEGYMFEGYLIGRGPVEITDKRTRDPRTIMRYRFELGSGARVSLLGSVMLDAALGDAPLDGSLAVRIAKGGSKETSNGNRMHDYIILTKPNARPVARPVTARVVETTAE